MIGGKLRFKRTSICTWWLQRREVPIVRCSLRGTSRGSAAGSDRECKRGNKQQTRWSGLLVVPCGESGVRNQREGDEGRRPRIAASTSAPSPPGPGAFPDRGGHVGRFLHPSDHRQTQGTLALLAKATSFGCQNLTRRLTGMTVRRAQANARISRLGRHSTVDRPAAFFVVHPHGSPLCRTSRCIAAPGAINLGITQHTANRHETMTAIPNEYPAFRAATSRVHLDQAPRWFTVPATG